LDFPSKCHHPEAYKPKAFSLAAARHIEMVRESQTNGGVPPFADEPIPFCSNVSSAIRQEKEALGHCLG
jgi:hypothetical protein